jgi:hypothetical protein
MTAISPAEMDVLREMAAQASASLRSGLAIVAAERGMRIAGPDSLSGAAMAKRYLGRLADKSARRCKHDPASDWAPFAWSPDSPGRIRCTACIAKKPRSVAPVCAMCSRPVSRAIRHGLVMDAEVRPGGHVIGPITITYGLCQSCAEKDNVSPGGRGV